MAATTSAPLVPEWLKLRDGAVQRGVTPETRFVMIAGQPLYMLEVRPTEGKFACVVTSTVNGKRLGSGTTYPAPDAALAGGLEQLRDTLGW